MKTRIRKSGSVYVVDEQVIPTSKHWASGAYITWPGCYGTQEAAAIAIKDERTRIARNLTQLV